jgi:hypothetical protein
MPSPVQEVKMKNLFCKLKNKTAEAAAKSRSILTGNAGEGYIDTAIKILIAVVLGALLLAGLYTLFGETVLFSSLRNHDRDCYA